MSATNPQAARLNSEWKTNARWRGVTRPYKAEDVVKLRGSVHIEHSLARMGAEKFWSLLHSEQVIGALGCMSGNQAVQAVQAGLKAIYCSGWQVAGDGNSAGEMYPDQSLYPVDSVPRMVERINNAPLRTDQIHHFEGRLSSAKKCGHMGGKVLVSTDEAVNKLVAARLAADVAGIPTVVIARTD